MFKSIQITKEIHRLLCLIKIESGAKNINEVIERMIQNGRTKRRK